MDDPTIREDLSYIRLPCPTCLRVLTSTVTGAGHAQNPALAALSVSNPEYDRSRIEASGGGHRQDLCEWFLKHASYVAWRDGTTDCDVLWLRGDAGTGKTMLLSGVINELEKNMDHPPKLVVSYCFCECEPATPTASLVLRQLAYLLAYRDGRLVHHVEEAYRKSIDRVFKGANGVFAASSLLATMLRDLSSSATPTYLVVDAVNECSGEEQKTLFAQIFKISSDCPHIRWVLSSRGAPSGDMASRFPPSRLVQVELDTNAVLTAVHHYINGKISSFKVSSDDNLVFQMRLKGSILAKCAANFRWASLACEELEAEPTEDRALQVLNEAPDLLYWMERRARVRMLLECGHTQYAEFKPLQRQARGGGRSDVVREREKPAYEQLAKAIAIFWDAYSMAKACIPQYAVGVTRAGLCLAECYRERSHRASHEFQARAKDLAKAERFASEARALARQTKDVVCEDRARLDGAVLRVNRVLLDYRLPDHLIPADVGDRVEKARAELAEMRALYNARGPLYKDVVEQADNWLGKLTKWSARREGVSASTADGK